MMVIYLVLFLGNRFTNTKIKLKTLFLTGEFIHSYGSLQMPKLSNYTNPVAMVSIHIY